MGYAAGGLGGFGEGGAEPFRPVAGAAGAAFAGRLVGAWADAGPGGEVSPASEDAAQR
jgi:hypothetical protein